jgi:hypothetical protein
MVVAAVLAWMLVVAITFGLLVRAARARRRRRPARAVDRALDRSDPELPGPRERQGLPERASNPGS